ncbi:hypothetical protein SLE2022_307800 [Rubroshorea leprosula]
MGFLDKLWDETLAGPMPDTGLGKLRKNSAARSPPAAEIMITRSITILKSANSSYPGSAPVTPSGSSTPKTPLTPGTPSGDFRRFSRRKLATEPLESAESRSPTVHDWIIINALDR